MLDSGLQDQGADGLPRHPLQDTRDEVCALIKEAIELYVEALEEDDLPVPEPNSYELVKV